MRGHHLEGVVLVDEKNRQAAAGARAPEVDHLGAGGLDHLLQRRLPLRHFGESKRIARPDHVAAIERSELQSRKIAYKMLLQPVETVLLDENPQQMLRDRITVILQPLRSEFGIYLSKIV